MKKKKLKINKGWFFGAGAMYNWTRDGHHPHGVGISRNVLKNNDQIEVTINDFKYLLDTKEAIMFVRHYGSIKQAGKTTLGVISRSLLTLISEPEPPVKFERKKEETLQESLFN